jgi:hypothetical protein
MSPTGQQSENKAAAVSGEEKIETARPRNGPTYFNTVQHFIVNENLSSNSPSLPPLALLDDLENWDD